MHYNYPIGSAFLLSFLLIVFITPVSTAGNFEQVYGFQAQYGLFSQKLYVSIQPSLYDCYCNATHTVNSDFDYAKFVTPQAVESIAQNLRTATRNFEYCDEHFADAVLMVVHQIRYSITGPKYPVETLVDDSGDCVALSLLAASIMKAGGLDVVLIHYIGIDPSHVNVGVYLPYTPVYHNIAVKPTGFEYNNRTYWTAEATPQAAWNVGDQSDSLANSIPVIIPLDDSELSSPAQVSSSLDGSLSPYLITVNLSESLSGQEDKRALIISGAVSPLVPNRDVTIYIDGRGSNQYFETTTDANGNYTFIWNFTLAGTYYVRASVSGDSNFTGSDSQTLTAFMGPESFLQFQAPDYNYVFGQTSAEVQPMQGVSDFLSVPLKGNMSFSFDFILLQTGHTKSNIQTTTITIPGNEQIVRTTNRQVNIQSPSRTVTIPVNVPAGLRPLSLPDDFNETINNQFSFILQNDQENNYTLNVKALNGYDVSNIQKGKDSNTTFINASDYIKENAWYRATANISQSGITAAVCNENGTLVGNVVTSYDVINGSKIVMLVANNMDSSIVIENFKTNNIENVTQSFGIAAKTTTASSLPLLHVSLPIIIFSLTAAVIVYLNKKQARNSA